MESTSASKKDLVELNNLFNKTKFSEFPATQQTAAMAIFKVFTQTKEPTVTIPYSVLRKNAKLDKASGINAREFTNILVRLTTAMMDFGGVFEVEPRRFLITRLFSEFWVDEEKQIVTATLAQRFVGYFYNNKREFMLLKLSQFVRLKTKYAKNLYRYLSQYAGTKKSGYWTVTYAEYKQCMAFPESQTPSQVWRATNKAVAEILAAGEFVKIDVSREYNNSVRGRPLVRLRFDFTKSEDKAVKDAAQTTTPNLPAFEPVYAWKDVGKTEFCYTDPAQPATLKRQHTPEWVQVPAKCPEGCGGVIQKWTAEKRGKTCYCCTNSEHFGLGKQCCHYYWDSKMDATKCPEKPQPIAEKKEQVDVISGANEPKADPFPIE